MRVRISEVQRMVGSGAQTPNIDPEPVRGYPNIHLDTHSQRVRSGGILNERFA